jgi:hypothetical protein
MRVNVYKLEVMIIDFDGIGVQDAKQVLENANYPNDCINPTVMHFEQRQIEFDDDHPLNNTRTSVAAYHDLFNNEQNVQASVATGDDQRKEP